MWLCEQGALHGALAGQVQGCVRASQTCPALRKASSTWPLASLPAEFVDEEESGDEKELADEGRSGRCVRLPLRRLAAGVHHPCPFADDAL